MDYNFIKHSNIEINDTYIRELFVNLKIEVILSQQRIDEKIRLSLLVNYQY